MLKEKRCYIGLVKIENVFDKVPRKVLEWAMRKKGIPGIWLDQ